MRTTALIVEFLVTGLAYLSALFAIYWQLGRSAITDGVSALPEGDTWAISIFIVGGALAYILGFVMNFGAYQLLRPLENRAFRRHFSGDHEFRMAEATFLAHSVDQHQMDVLANELSFLRISRAATLVAFLYALAATLAHALLLATVILGLGGLAMWSTFYRADRYFALTAGLADLLTVGSSTDGSRELDAATPSASTT